MTTSTAAPPPARDWGDERLAQACTRASAHPAPFGRHAYAWRTAAVLFANAHRATGDGRAAAATGYRTQAYQVLTQAGLRIEEAFSGRPASTPAVPAPTVFVPVTARAQQERVLEYTTRVTHLRGEAERASVQHTEQAALRYAAACCYERAVREWAQGNVPGGEEWARTADRMLDDHVIPVPWRYPSPAN